MPARAHLPGSSPPRRALVGLLALLSAVALAMGAVAAPASAAGHPTMWLCRPGTHPDPCDPALSTTVYSPTLHRLRVTQPRAAKRPAIDCFYVYPTISDQKTPVANLHIDPEERSIARYQAARYAQYCRVFAPMYRQFTLTALFGKVTPTPSELAIPQDDIRQAFDTYLRKYNHGRGFVLIGHSQGAFILRRLIAAGIDRRPSLRRRLVSAILLGGNVLVKRDKAAGGDFEHIPACRATTQIGCVIAFSTFDGPVPANSLFGRTSVHGDQVLCTNPAALAGGPGWLDAIFPSRAFAAGTLAAAAIKILGLTQPHPPTVWFTLPGAYRARCSSTGGASALQVVAQRGAQTATPSPDPTWGLHLLDANIALGNLISIVHAEAAAYASQRGAHA